MRRILAALTLAASLSLMPGPGLAAEPAAPPAAAPDGASATPDTNYAPGDPDAPPPFIKRPPQKPQPIRPDRTYAVKPAPKDFRGLAWGATLQEAQAQFGLTPVKQPLPLAGTYMRPDELLKLGLADIRSVAYYFPKGRLAGVGIVLEGQANFFLAKDHLIELYGPGRQVGSHYGWTWADFNIDLRLNGDTGELRYTHEP